MHKSFSAKETYRIEASGVLVGVWKRREREHREKSPTIEKERLTIW